MNREAIVVDLDHLKREGYFIARNLLDSKTDLQPIVDEYSTVLDDLARSWLTQEKISSLHSDLSFAERVCQFIADGRDPLTHFDITLPSKTTEETSIHLGPAVFQLLRHPRILDVVEQIMGAEIYCSPVQHIRIKPPEKRVPQELLTGLNAAVGWHQDLGVVSDEADETRMISVWVAVYDATVENGCLQVVPGSHRGDLAVHCSYGEGKRRYFQINIPDQLVPSGARALPMKAGDVLFFEKKLMHSSLPNLSDGIRWSFDLRYNPVGQPTGRPWLPGFIARSRTRPETELRDPAQWKKMWLETRTRLASGEGIKPSSRWNSNHPACA